MRANDDTSSEEYGSSDEDIPTKMKNMINKLVGGNDQSDEICAESFKDDSIWAILIVKT